MLVQVYGRKAVSRKSVYEWFKRFREGKETTEDESRSGRHAEPQIWSRKCDKCWHKIGDWRLDWLRSKWALARTRRSPSSAMTWVSGRTAPDLCSTSSCGLHPVSPLEDGHQRCTFSGRECHQRSCDCCSAIDSTGNLCCFFFRKLYWRCQTCCSGWGTFWKTIKKICLCLLFCLFFGRIYLHFRRTVYTGVQLFLLLVVIDLGLTTLITSQVIGVAFYSEREKSDKFCSEALISAWRFFYVPKIYDTGHTVLLFFRRNPYSGFLRCEKIHRPR